MYCGKEGQTPAAADCPKGCCKGQTSYELSRGKKKRPENKGKNWSANLAHGSPDQVRT